MSETQDSDYEPTEFEEKLDELNEGLLEAYAAGFSEAVSTFSIDTAIDTDVKSLKQNEEIRECHYYYWDGRTKPLKFWLEDLLTEGGDADE